MHVIARFAILALAAFTALAAAATLWWPFGWDQGIFAWIGGAMLGGGAPYRDAWDVKGPLTFLPFALTEALFGRVMWGIRLFDLILLAAAAAAIRRVVAVHTVRGAATGAALLYVLAYLGFGYWHTAQPDGWVALAALIGWAPLFTDGRGAGRAGTVFGAGAVVGLALLAKPVYLVLVLVPLAALAIARELPPARRRRLALMLAAGVLAPIVVCIGGLAVFGGPGAVAALVETYLRFNAELAAAGQGSLVEVGRRTYRLLIDRPVVLLALPAAGAGLAVLARDVPRCAVLLGGWLVIALAIVFAQGRLFGYHWHAVFAPLALLTAVGVGRLWHPGGARAALETRVAVLLLSLLLAAVVARRPARETLTWLEYLTGRISRAEYLALYDYPGLGYSPGDDRLAAAWLTARTSPDARVLAWSDPAVNWLARRETPGRFGFHIPVNSFSGTPLTARQERYRTELLGDLARHAPQYILVADRALAYEPDYQLSIPGQFPALAELLDRDYSPVERLGGWHVYTHRDSTRR